MGYVDLFVAVGDECVEVGDVVFCGGECYLWEDCVVGEYLFGVLVGGWEEGFCVYFGVFVDCYGVVCCVGGYG